MLLAERWVVPNVNTLYFSGLKIVLCENKEEEGLLGKLHNIRLLFCSPGTGLRCAALSLLPALLYPQCAFAWLYWPYWLYCLVALRVEQFLSPLLDLS